MRDNRQIQLGVFVAQHVRKDKPEVVRVFDWDGSIVVQAENGQISSSYKWKKIKTVEVN